jgi:hypothetical protein
MKQTLLEYTDELRRLGFVYKNICRRHECDELLKRYPCNSWLFVSLPDSYFDFVELWIVPLQKVEKRLLDGSSVLNNIRIRTEPRGKTLLKY